MSKFLEGGNEKRHDTFQLKHPVSGQYLNPLITGYKL
jgi:hypothetical protein